MALVGRISKLETFGLVDGPGVRFVAFVQGCMMRCRYCHNPETWPLQGGTEWEPAALLQRALRYRNYWKTNGGITVSGGEPLLQVEFMAEFFRLAKQEGVHTALDTSGRPFTEEEPFYSHFCRLMEHTDLVLLDLKQLDPAAHHSLTGQPNDSILAMARWLSDHGIPMWIRRVLVPGLTDDPEELARLRDFIASLNGVQRVEILPYHTLALGKWQQLGIPYPLPDTPPPTPEQISRAEEILGISSTSLS